MNIEEIESLMESIEDDEYEGVVLKELAMTLRKQDLKTAIINPKRIKEVVGIYNNLKKYFYSKNVIVKMSLFEPYKSMGSISMEGRVIPFDNPETLSEIAKRATSIECFRKTNGNIVLEYTFYGLTVPIE